MKELLIRDKIRPRMTRLNRCILIVALLWIAMTIALILEAHPDMHAKSSARRGNEVASLQYLSVPKAINRAQFQDKTFC